PLTIAKLFDDQAVVQADDQAVVQADDQAVVQADDQAVVQADDQAVVQADDQAVVQADDQAVVQADDQAVVQADDQAVVQADDQAVVQADERCAAILSHLKKLRTYPDIKSCLSLQFMTDDNVYGIIDILSSDSHAFNPERLVFWKTLGRQIGVAIQNARLFEEARASREQQKALSRRLLEVHEIERRAIGHELHDEIGQSLTGLKLMLETVRHQSANGITSKILTATEIVNEL